MQTTINELRYQFQGMDVVEYNRGSGFGGGARYHFNGTPAQADAFLKHVQSQYPPAGYGTDMIPTALGYRIDRMGTCD